MDQARLFLALWPGPGVRSALAQWRDAWDWPRGASPVADGRLHLTLHFLGNVERARVPQLAQALEVPFQRFELRFGTAALWPHGVAVVEPLAAPARLLALQAALGGALAREGVALDARAYRPHVTLARRAAQARAPAHGTALRWNVGGYALMESTLGPNGAYTVIRRYPVVPAQRK